MMRIRSPSDTLPALAGIVTLTLLVLVAYWPGINGPFLFDDYSNLGTLTRFGHPASLQDLLTILGNGIAGPTGRPVSLASFLLNDTGWPSDPGSFKYTNILLHALNTLLLCWLLLVAGRVAGLTGRKALQVAMLASFCWACSPLMVSTVLYVVQRMAMLATTFVLLSLLLYLKARICLQQDRIGAAVPMMGLSFAVCGTLSVLSKENGVLLPLLLLVFELAYLQVVAPLDANRTGGRLLRLVVLLAFLMPVLLLVGYLAWKLPDYAAQAAQGREFSITERLLTEPRVLIQYLWLLIIPRMQTQGLYHDDLELSTGLLVPWATLPALALLVAVLVFCIRQRRRWPLLSLAGLFFLAGHSLEATVIPLELYYEHRNYLPAIFLFWPFAHFALTRPDQVRSGLKLFVCSAYVLALFVSTVLRSDLWRDELRLSLVWAEASPRSERAQLQAAKVLAATGREVEAMAFVRRGTNEHPDSLVLVLAGLNLTCKVGGTADWLDTAREVLSGGEFNAQYAFRSLGLLLKAVEAGQCPAVSSLDLLGLADAIASNPNAGGHPVVMHGIHHFQGRVHLAQHNEQQAYQSFFNAMQWSATPEGVLQEAALLGNAGYTRSALRLITHYQHQYVASGKLHLEGVAVLRLDYLLGEIERMRRELEKQLGHDDPDALYNIDSQNESDVRVLQY